MTDQHDVLCPTFIDCENCQQKRNSENKRKIIDYFDQYVQETEANYLYQLTINLKPTREIYHRFSIDPLKKVGRELINGLSSISGTSNRRFWNLYIEAGIRFFEIKQKNEEEYPEFSQHFLFLSYNDNLDSKLRIQLKYRIAKISRDLTFNLKYLGNFGKQNLDNAISTDVKIYKDSITFRKLGEEVINEISKFRDQKPIAFGRKTSKQILIPSEINN